MPFPDSRQLVLHLGLSEVGEQWDEEDGTEIVYEIAAPSPDRRAAAPDAVG